MTRVALLLVGLVCPVWALGFVSFQSQALAAKKSDGNFQKLWDDTKVNLSTKTGSKETDSKAEKKPAADQRASEEPKKPKLSKQKRVGSGTPPGLLKGQEQRQSGRAVCRSQCSLERMSCDQGNNGFQNRSDQLKAAQSSCFLAVQSCLSRC
jgi:hypothetical protein